MPLVPTVVAVLLVLSSAGGSAVSVTDLSLSLPAINNSFRGVACGPYGQQCPSSSPICCGPPNYLYCVSAGSTCCTPQHAFWSFSPSSCAQGEVCCAGDTTAICCPGETICTLVKTMSGLVAPQCMRHDACNAHRTADSCLHAGASGHACGWCCEEQKCVALTDRETQRPNQCMDGVTLPVAPGRQCPSRCSYATTCELCEGAYREYGGEKDPCTWCCASMSCMPSDKAATQCENQQIVSTVEQCDACLAGGDGVNEKTASETESLLEIIFSLLLFVAVVFVLVVWRVLYDHVFGSPGEAEGATTDIVPQEAVRRYGFARSDRAPSSPLHHHRRMPGLSRENKTAAGTCCCGVCKRTLSVRHLRTQLLGAPPPAHAPSTTDSQANGTTSTPPADGAHAQASCLDELPTPLFDPASPSPAAQEASVPSQEGELTSAGTTTRDSATPPVDEERGDDPMAILLPCEHVICFTCLGVSAPQETVARSVNRDPQSTSSSRGAGDSSEDAVERALHSRWKNKCPVCQGAIVDVIIPTRVIAL